MTPLTAHLDAVGETYLQHLRHALGFSRVMFVGSVVCLIHALFPFLFERTGSNYIRTLHERMVTSRHRLTPPAARRAQAVDMPYS